MIPPHTFKTYTPDAIRAKEEELAAWELKLVDAIERAHNAPSNRYYDVWLSYNNIKSVVDHLRGQLRTMKRREWA